MKNKSKKRFTVKIIVSYLFLAALALTAGYFIYSEVHGFLNYGKGEDTDKKLLKTGNLVTQLYQAESLSKLALQSGTQENFDAYAAKIDTLVFKIDTLKLLSTSGQQNNLLDSVQLLLKQKIANSNELRNLRAKNYAGNSIDKALNEFRKLETSFGKLTIYTFEPHPERLSPYKRKVLEDWVDYLNENIPEQSATISDVEKIDSILNASKALLAQAKKNDAKTQQFISQKEKLINTSDLELSSQLQSIIAVIEKEMILNSYAQSQERKLVLRRSIRLAAGAALLGFLVVAVFTFLINRDFWRIQSYRERLEKEKKFSESLLKSREQLISTVSHDLRTPLNTITGYTELMEGTPLSQKQKQYLKNVKSSSEYVGNLVNDLLDFSKLEAGKLHFEKVPFVLVNLIQETAEGIQSLHSKKDIKLYLEIDDSLQTPILGDPFRIRQVLTNLIGNAFKFTDEGTIHIHASATQKGKAMQARIDVVDTGIGIPKDKQRLIFNEFTQADSKTEKKFGGYGLGLTISKKLSHLLGGKLRVKSEVGKGSTFSLHLPFQISNVSIAAAKEGHYMARKLHMLIIDDDTALLRMLKELLASMGITAHIFPNFLQVEKDTFLDYDLVLTDIQMPQITGFQVLKRLKSGTYKHYSDQPIIAMTGRRDLEMEAYTSLGFAQVLQKPFSKKELMAMLKLLGLANEIPQEEEAEEALNAPKLVNSSSYNLDLIHSFLGTNEDVVNEVLYTFFSDTNQNMIALRAAVNVWDYNEINQTTHRMLPMFRQLKVVCVPVLERMEIATVDTMNKDAMKEGLKKLELSVSTLLSALEKRFATSPTYNG
ncbi:ATP-binding protein [Maribacter sp.]|nr:ATP-binding protein [Maribacter sp.]